MFTMFTVSPPIFRVFFHADHAAKSIKMPKKAQNYAAACGDSEKIASPHAAACGDFDENLAASSKPDRQAHLSAKLQRVSRTLVQKMKMREKN